MALADRPSLTAYAAGVTDLREAARHWADTDPDPTTRAALEALIEANDTEGLTRAMGDPLSFGTAGIRGEVGPGSGRMNRATVIRATRGLADYLLSVHQGPPTSPVVVGFDARPDSRTFAEDTAGVLAAAGISVRYFPVVTPTPLVAFAAKQLRAAAAVVVTASHHPPADNGDKVYDANAAQIIPPVDTEIASRILAAAPASEIPRVENAFGERHDSIASLGEEIFDSYQAEVQTARPSPHSSDLEIVYTPLHGVGGETLLRMLSAAGHRRVVPVPEQIAPDGAFPTVRFPNPEEPGALDLALDLARREDADLVLANDPDADRLAVAVPDEGDWRLLSGNELGALLGDSVLTHWKGDMTPIVVNSVVSSPMMGRIAEARGAVHEVTLTGFKWIINAGLALEEEGKGRFAFGYEEALGYSVGRTVRDKDGIAAAVVMADLAAEAAQSGSFVLDRLFGLWDEFGVWVSAQHSIVRTGADGAALLLAAVDRLASGPPSAVGGSEITGVTDYRVGEESRPPWLGAQDLVELTLADGGRLLVRPSGTEPKLKIYVDLSGDAGGDHRAAHDGLLARASDIAKAMGEWLEV